MVNERVTDDFGSAAPLEDHLGGWSIRLQDGVLTATPAEAFRSRKLAREDLEQRLREWSQSAFLTADAFRFRFDYERSDVEVIDPDARNVHVFPEPARLTLTMGEPTVQRGHRTFPPPDTTFRRTPLTDLLSERLHALRDGRAELPAVAYLVLSAIETSFGGRKKCAATLFVDPRVLGNLGRLSSQFDPEIGRKAEGDPKPLAAQELAWLQAVVVRLVRRVGEHATGRPIRQMTLNDFPPLS